MGPSLMKNFRMTISEKILLEKKNLKLAFDTFDIDKDGQLSKEELINALGTGTSDLCK